MTSSDDVIQLRNFINGEFKDTSCYLDSENPATGQVFVKVPDSDASDVDAAVTAAKNAFKTWSVTSYAERAVILERIASNIEQRLDEFAEAESRDQGKPLSLARTIDIPRAVHNFRFFAGASRFQMDRSLYLDKVDAVNYVSRLPIGVAALISPWNLPLYLLTFKIAPAIIHGNTVVCKPSEMTSLTAYKMATILNESGLPPGVVNIVFGTGPRAGDAMVRHPDVKLVSFTGSTLTGQKIREAASARCKNVSLELGGKNSALIFDDAELDKCIETTLRSCFTNQGEVCLCTSKVYVHRNIYDTFLEKFLAGVRSIEVGNPLHATTKMGALISKQHLEKVKGYVDLARKEGATIRCGDGIDALDLPTDNAKGYFMAPTVITDLQPDSRCMTEEIFGPVACVVPFDSESEAIEAANNVEYGLCAVLWTKDVTRIHRVARELQAGTVWTNCWMVRDLRVPFGGVKESGIGREGLDESLEFYTEMQTLCIKL